MLLNLTYGAILVFLSPWLLVRSIRTGRYRRNLRAKLFGQSTTIVESANRVAWFHGVSVGEVHLLRQLVKAFRARHPDWQIVISSTTDTGLAEAHKHFSDLAVIAYPFDFTWAVRRTIAQIRPSMIVLAESELWPNFLRAAERAGVPVVVVNGRMSPRTSRRYARIAALARRLLFNRVARFGMQSETYGQNLRRLGVAPERIVVTGNIKYDGVLFERANAKTQDLARVFGIAAADLVWVAGSTHDPEERIVLGVFCKLRERFRALRLILVPRAPERFDEVARLIEATGIAFARRSRWPTEPAVPPIVLIDTMGELSAVWGLATIGFTGGSLNDQRGGQSMIEPAAFGVPVMFGPHTWNFRDAVAGLLERNGAMQVADALELERTAARLLADADLRQRTGKAAQEFVQSQQGATTRTLNMMEVVPTSPR